MLRRRALLEVLFPAIEHYLRAGIRAAWSSNCCVQGLRNTDARVAADKPVTPTFLFALLLYGPIAEAIESLPPQRWHEIGAIVEACDHALREASARVTIPRRMALGRARDVRVAAAARATARQARLAPARAAALSRGV